MEKSSKKNYWAVISFDGGILFEGSHSLCWEFLTTNFSDRTVKQLLDKGIKITRIN